MTLNDLKQRNGHYFCPILPNLVVALILHYFTEFVYDIVVKQLLGLPRFKNLLLIVYLYHMRN